MYFRKLIFVLAIVLFASSCTKQIDTTKPYKVSSNASWVQELKQRNPLKDSANITCVYFCYDTIVNDYKASGINKNNSNCNGVSNSFFFVGKQGKL